jgi:hypothetical protein
MQIMLALTDMLLQYPVHVQHNISLTICRYLETSWYCVWRRNVRICATLFALRPVLLVLTGRVPLWPRPTRSHGQYDADFTQTVRLVSNARSANQNSRQPRSESRHIILRLIHCMTNCTLCTYCNIGHTQHHQEHQCNVKTADLFKMFR